MQSFGHGVRAEVESVGVAALWAFIFAKNIKFCCLRDYNAEDGLSASAKAVCEEDAQQKIAIPL